MHSNKPLHRTKKPSDNKTLKIAIAFAIIATMQFLFFLTNYGPLTCCDPKAHLAGTYGLATGQILNPTQTTTDKVNVDEYLGTYHVQEMSLPKNLTANEKDVFNNKIVSLLVQETKDNMRELQKTELTDMEKSTDTVTQYTRANQNFPAYYVPTAIGMKIAMLLGKSSWGLLQMARISNFIFYLAIIILSIVIIPRGKLALASIGLLPPSIFISSSIMPDSTLIALCSLYVAIALYFIFNNRLMQVKHMVIVALLTLFIMLIKLPYGALALIYIFMPKHIWQTKAKAITCSVTLLVFVIFYLSWSNNYQLILLLPEVDYYTQLNYFYSHFIFVLFNCLANSLNFLLITIPYSYQALFVFVSLITLGIISKYRQKMEFYVIIAIVIVALTMVATYLFLFLTWNSYQGIMPQFIEGFQERYLLPLLPLLLVMCQKPKQPRKTKITTTQNMIDSTSSL